MKIIPVDAYPLPTTRIDPYTCQWFIHCGNRPAGTVRHRILGDVPCCWRCATALHLALDAFEVPDPPYDGLDDKDLP